MGYNNDSEQQESSNSLHNELSQTATNLAASKVKDSIVKNAKVAGRDTLFNSGKSANTTTNGKTVGKSVDTGKKIAKNSSKAAAASKGAATAGTAAATGAATGGVGAIVTATIAILKKMNIDLNKTDGTTNVKKETTHSFVWIFAIIIIAFCLIIQIILTPVTVAFYPLMTAYEKVTEVGTEIINKGKVLFLNMTDKERCNYFKELFGVDKYDIELDRKVSQEMQIDENKVIK